MRTHLFKWFWLTVLFVATFCVRAQCPEGDIQLEGQSAIENFNTNYPSCTQLQGRLQISGMDVTDLSPLSTITSVKGLIIQNTSLVNLSGLESIISIDGNLRVSNNNIITSFEGLENITQVTEMDLNSNPALVDLAGLNSLTTVTLGRVQINWNNALESISGLQNLNSIAGNFEIKANPLLTDLSGLSSISSVGGIALMFNNNLDNVDDLNGLTNVTEDGLLISFNESLTSLEGFLGLIDLGNSPLQITYNDTLQSLYGLDNIDPSSISNLFIQSSQQLATCNVTSICDYLTAGGTATISGNSVGCNSIPEVQAFCEGFSDCPTGDVILSTQAEVDLFLVQYPDCSTIQGNLFIGSETNPTDIVNLISLQKIINVVGNVTIQDTYIENMTGLNFLVQIGGDLYISDNPNLESLTALNNLTTISGSQLAITNNDALVSLIGLDNINPSSISHLILESSQNLTTCDIESICTYISTFGSSYSISGNATGCNSFEEVLDACQDILPGCPTGDVEFLTQAEVDHFIVQYPNCENLNGALKIGSVNENNINNLLPLQNIRSANGALGINKTSLTNLQGLNNFQFINASEEGNSSLEILFNSSLTSLEGLENYTSSNNIFIQSNPSLVSLNGLSGLSGFEGVIIISDNDSLPNLSGLNNLVSCYKLDITGNDNLETLEGLNNLENIVGDFTLNNNMSLASLTALSNLESVYGPGDNGLGGWLRIQENSSLTNLEGLNHLSSLNGLLILNNENLENISALSSITEINGQNVGALNEINVAGNNSLTSLNGLHNITSVGFELEGGVTGKVNISGNSSLEDVALTSLERIYSDLSIQHNPNITSLDGISNLTRIDANLFISNNEQLTSLEGLNNLSHFGILDGWPSVLAIENNNSLENINALNNISQVLDYDLLIAVSGNPELTSLSGLDNINSTSISPNYGIILRENVQLSNCSISPICGWLSDGGLNEIHNNTAGCNSSEEILELCELNIEEIPNENQITFYPVPAKQILNISVQNSTKIESVSVFDLTGKLVLKSNNSDSKINLSHLNSGTYLVSVKTNKGIHTEKIIKK